MNTFVRWIAGLSAGAAILAGAWWLVSHGVYGLTLFLIVPTLLGAMVAAISRPPTATHAGVAGACAAVFGSVALLGLGVEGGICIVMTLPLSIPGGAIGGWLVYLFQSCILESRGAAMLLLLPVGTFGFDATAHPPVFEVRSSVEIAASPEQVWKHVVTFSDLPEPTQWYFRAGLAYPKRARIEGTGVGAVRYCEFSTGPFVEPIEVWDEPRLLRFRVTQNPAPMHEWSPYAEVLPKHLHGYLISKHGQFRLTPMGPNRTLLEGTTWYQHGLWPAQYWRLWSDAIIHRIHLRVLEHIRTLAEAENARAAYSERTTK